MYKVQDDDQKIILSVYERLLYHKTFSDDDIEVLKEYENKWQTKPYSYLEYPANEQLKKRIESFIINRAELKHINDGHIKNLPNYLKVCLCSNCNCTITDREFADYLPSVRIKGIKVEDSSGESVIYEGENISCLEEKLLTYGYKFIRKDKKCLIYFKG